MPIVRCNDPLFDLLQIIAKVFSQVLQLSLFLLNVKMKEQDINKEENLNA